MVSVHPRPARTPWRMPQPQAPKLRGRRPAGKFAQGLVKAWSRGNPRCSRIQRRLRVSWGCSKEQGCWERALLCDGTGLGGRISPGLGLCTQRCWLKTRASQLRAATPYPGPLPVFCGGWLTMLPAGNLTALPRKLSFRSERFAWGAPDSGFTGNPAGKRMCGLWEVPGQEFSEPANLRKSWCLSLKGGESFR